jgi:hypothetical protein
LAVDLKNDYGGNMDSKGLNKGSTVWVVYNINGDVIGVAGSHDGAVKILDERYKWTPVELNTDSHNMDRAI